MDNNEDGRGDIGNIEVSGYMWKSMDDTLVYGTMGTVGVVDEEAEYISLEGRRVWNLAIENEDNLKLYVLIFFIAF